MDRRNALKITAGAIAGGGAGIVTLANAFKPGNKVAEESRKLPCTQAQSDWMYHPLNPAATAELAYHEYVNGSCMYATFFSMVAQMADQHGEPYASFPLHMMKYGHGGIGGYGTTCGALNAAAALVGLFVPEKAVQDELIRGLFRWYEQSELPEFRPGKPILEFNPPGSISNSTLCHASTTNWGKASGYKITSDQRKERCRRLTGDVAARTNYVLNDYFNNRYVTGTQNNESVGSCMVCHGKEGKLANTSGKMSCISCHRESAGHKVFSDIHYKLMKDN